MGGRMATKRNDSAAFNRLMLERLAEALDRCEQQGGRFTLTASPGVLPFLRESVNRGLADSPDPFGTRRGKGLSGRPQWERFRVAEYIHHRAREIGFEAAREEAGKLFNIGSGPNGQAEKDYREFRDQIEVNEQVYRALNSRPE